MNVVGEQGKAARAAPSPDREDVARATHRLDRRGAEPRSERRRSQGRERGRWRAMGVTNGGPRADHGSPSAARGAAPWPAGRNRAAVEPACGAVGDGSIDPVVLEASAVLEPTCSVKPDAVSFGELGQRQVERDAETEQDRDAVFGAPVARTDSKLLELRGPRLEPAATALDVRVHSRRVALQVFANLTAGSLARPDAIRARAELEQLGATVPAQHELPEPVAGVDVSPDEVEIGASRRSEVGDAEAVGHHACRGGESRHAHRPWGRWGWSACPCVACRDGCESEHQSSPAWVSHTGNLASARRGVKDAVVLPSPAAFHVASSA